MLKEKPREVPSPHWTPSNARSNAEAKNVFMEDTNQYWHQPTPLMNTLHASEATGNKTHMTHPDDVSKMTFPKGGEPSQNSQFSPMRPVNGFFEDSQKQLSGSSLAKRNT